MATQLSFLFQFLFPFFRIFFLDFHFFRLRSMLKPEYVASEVVAAIATNEILVVLPGIIKYLLPLKL
jgi:hypothetical protein